MDVLIPSYTSYLAVISLPYHKRGTWRYTACDFSGGGNHSPTILTSYKTEVCFLFLASSFYLLAVLEVSGSPVLFSRPVVVLRYCFRFNLVFCWQLHFKTNGKLRNPKKAGVVWLLLFGIFCLHSCREALADQKLSIRAFELVDEMMLGVMVHGWTSFAPLFGLLVEDEYIYIYRRIGYR